MRLVLGLIAGLALLPHTGVAQSEQALAETAVAQLQSAAFLLERANSARDRVRALTETVAAYETALDAIRDGLRAATIQETRLSLQLDAKRDRIERLVSVLQAIGKAPEPSLLLHPSGPTGTARAGMILADVTPALQKEAEALARELSALSEARQLRQQTLEHLQTGLVGVQLARTELSQAISNRTDLPKKFSEDPVQTALLLASTETLEQFAGGLNTIPKNGVSGAVPDVTALKGTLDLPVLGAILRRFKEAGAAGIERPGIIMATRPGSLVVTPVAATIRYMGPLFDYGNVMILEPSQETLFVFAGLETVYGETGQVVPAGHPVGMMGDTSAVTGSAESGNSTETLYIEVREDNTPVDPLSWFFAG